MSFYVVQTRKSKRSKPSVTVVPSNWVKNNVVHWPPNNLITLAKDKDSTPDENNWKQQKCKIVAKAATFVQAEETMHTLESITDSEDAIELSRGTRSHPAKKKPKFVSNTYELALPISRSATQNPVIQEKGEKALHELNSDTTDASTSKLPLKPPKSVKNTLLGHILTDAKGNRVVSHSGTSITDKIITGQENTTSNLITQQPFETISDRFQNIAYHTSTPHCSLTLDHSPKLVGTDRKDTTKLDSAEISTNLAPAFAENIYLESKEMQNRSISAVPKQVKHLPITAITPPTRNEATEAFPQPQSMSLRYSESTIFRTISPQKLPVHSNQSIQENNPMFTIQTTVDGLGRQYLQLADGTLVQISIENSNTVENEMVNKTAAQIEPVDPIGHPIQRIIYANDGFQSL